MGKRARLIDEYRKKNPNATWDEIIQKFFKAVKTPELHCMESDINKQIFELLWSNRDLFKQDKIGSQLFKGVDSEENFGVSHGLTNVVYHLLDLLEIKELKNDYANDWIATGKASDSYGNAIILEYELSASSKEEARTQLEEYKKMMKAEGILALLAYWKKANDKGKPEYTCSLIEIMECMSDPNRTAKFIPEERQRFWNRTRILQKTTIKAERPTFKTNKDGKKVKVQNGKIKWAEQRLVDILGGYKEESSGDKYPLTVSVKLLSETFAKEFAPALYKNRTLRLDPSDVFFAFIIQTRHAQIESQMERGKKKTKIKRETLDWDYLFKNTNQERTAKTNRRVAKVRVRKKIQNLIEADIVDKAIENKDGILPVIKPFKKKSSTIQ